MFSIWSQLAKREKSYAHACPRTPPHERSRTEFQMSILGGLYYTCFDGSTCQPRSTLVNPVAVTDALGGKLLFTHLSRFSAYACMFPFTFLRRTLLPALGSSPLPLGAEKRVEWRSGTSVTLSHRPQATCSRMTEEYQKCRRRNRGPSSARLQEAANDDGLLASSGTSLGRVRPSIAT